MSEEKLRDALEAARGQLLKDCPPEIIEKIDDALKSEPFDFDEVERIGYEKGYARGKEDDKTLWHRAYAQGVQDTGSCASVKILELTEQIKTQHLTVEELTFKIEDLEHDLAKLKSKMLDEVLKARDDDGKPVYTNQETRKLAVEEKLDASNEYHVLVDEIKVTKRRLTNERIELEYRNNLFRAHLAVMGAR